MEITDTNGAVVSNVPIEIAEGEESQIVVARIPCVAGYYLAAEENATVTVLARVTGSGASFADIADEPVDLSPYADGLVSFDFKVSAGLVTEMQLLSVAVRVTRNP